MRMVNDGYNTRISTGYSGRLYEPVTDKVMTATGGSGSEGNPLEQKVAQYQVSSRVVAAQKRGWKKPSLFELGLVSRGSYGRKRSSCRAGL